MNWTSYLLGALSGLGLFAFLAALAVAAAGFATKHALSNPAIIMAIVSSMMKGGKNVPAATKPAASFNTGIFSTGNATIPGTIKQENAGQ